MGQLRKAVPASLRLKRRRDVIGIVIYGRGVRYSAARQREVIAVAVRQRKWLEIGKHDRLLDKSSTPQSPVGASQSTGCSSSAISTAGLGKKNLSWQTL